MQEKFDELTLGKIRISELEIETNLLCASFSFLCITNSIICIPQSVKLSSKGINYKSVTEIFTYLNIFRKLKKNSGDIFSLM